MSKFNLSQTVGANLEWPQTFAKIKVALNHLAKSSILVFTLKVACELQYNLQISLTTAYQTRFYVISICFLVKLNWKAFRFGNVFSSPRVKAYVKPAEWSLQSAIMRSYRQTKLNLFSRATRKRKENLCDRQLKAVDCEYLRNLFLFGRLLTNGFLNKDSKFVPMFG